MADEANDQDVVVDKTADELKNIKSEFARKQDNTNKELESIKNMLAGIAQSQQAKPAPKQSEKPDPLLDPEAYEQYITEKISSRMDQSINQNNQRQSQLTALVQNYPELQDANNALTKRAVEVYNQLSQEEKMSPNAYKFAVQDAAAELGVVAVSKRKQSDSDDFTIDSSNNRGSNNSNKRQKADKIDDATLAIAELMGRPVNDPKYIESLKKHVGRKNWNKGE